MNLNTILRATKDLSFAEDMSQGTTSVVRQRTYLIFQSGLQPATRVAG